MESEKPHPNNILAAIVGQPNSGKSTIFNLLTRIHQETGNYPGLTTDAKTGHYHEGNFRIEVVDLPGTYTLSSSSQSERIVKNFLLLDRPEVVLLVIDIANFRRHLSFALELLEMQIPTILCLNFKDVAERRGIQIDPESVAAITGMPVVSMVASKGVGLSDLRRAILSLGRLDEHEPNDWRIDYGPQLEQKLGEIEERIRDKHHLAEDFSPRWLAVKLMESDFEARRFVEHHTHDNSWQELLDYCDERIDLFMLAEKNTPKRTILDRRFHLAEELDRKCISRLRPRTVHFSDRIDSVVCHPIFGPFILFLLMFVVFQLTFQLADGWKFLPLLTGEGVEWLTPVGLLSHIFHCWLPSSIAALLGIGPGALSSFLYDGIFAGMGGVLQFVPVIFVMFTMLALLEQSGYIARVAMVMDNFMRRFGLQGGSVLPMVLGGGLSGGCAVPAIMAARSIPNRRQRLLTILVIPMLNCGGKLPVFTMLIGTYFISYQGLVMTGIVFFSWTLALLSALILGKTILKGPELPLLLELPSYQLPRSREVFLTAARQSGEFLKKAGTIILAANIILWFLMSYPSSSESSGKQDIRTSYAASIGRFLEPVSQWAGFDWKDNVALLGGLATKELIVSSVITLNGMNTEQNNISPLSDERREHYQGQTGPVDSTAEIRADVTQGGAGKGLALLIFVMLYAPCSGTLVAVYRMTGELRWSLLSLVYNTVLAFLLAVAIYQSSFFFSRG